MSTLNIHRVNALPATLAPHSLYIVKSSTHGLAELVFTTSTGEAVKSIDSSTVSTMISAALRKTASLEIVTTIEDRDQLQLTTDAIIYVLDATEDPSITEGGALYGYKYLTGEYTLMLSTGRAPSRWEEIVGKPVSSAEQIDAAVDMAHRHENLGTLNQLSDVNGQLHYRGQPVSTVHIGLTDW